MAKIGNGAGGDPRQAPTGEKGRFGMKSMTVAITGALLVGMGVASMAQTEEQESNLLRNGGFELLAEGTQGFPDTWGTFTSHKDSIALVKGSSREGIQALILGAQGESKANVGVFQRLPVQAGKQYTFAAHLMNDPTNSLKGSAYGEMSIEWKDADDNEIARVRSKSWGPGLSKTSWERNAVTEKAPSGADSCNVVITLFDGPSASSKGGFLIDDVSVTSN
jgi:hypothetical protein